MLGKHFNRNDPFIYLTGISSDELPAMFDFMHHVEVIIVATKMVYRRMLQKNTAQNLTILEN